jgi:hypothetical protein
VRILPTAAWAGMAAARIGLVCGVAYSVGGLIYDLLTIGLNWGTAMAFMALVGMPVLFGAAGFLSGALIPSAVLGVRAAVGPIKPPDDP